MVGGRGSAPDRTWAVPSAHGLVDPARVQPAQLRRNTRYRSSPATGSRPSSSTTDSQVPGRYDSRPPGSPGLWTAPPAPPGCGLPSRSGAPPSPGEGGACPPAAGAPPGAGAVAGAGGSWWVTLSGAGRTAAAWAAWRPL